MIQDTIPYGPGGLAYLKPFFDIERERLWVRRQAVFSLFDENLKLRSLDDIESRYRIEADALP